MERGSNIKDFTEGNVTGQLLRFATPLFLSSMLQIVYNMADMIIVGQKLGKVGLSAVSIGGDLTYFLTFIAMGFSNAGQVIISQYLGAGDRKKISPFIGTMFSFLMLCAACVSAVCLVLRSHILSWMHTPPEAFSEALAYSTICMAGLVFIYGYNIVSAVLRGMGDSMRPFIFISAASVMNIALDLLFVMGLGLGSAGAAAATVLSQCASFAACAFYIARNRDRYSLDLTARTLLRIEPELLSRLIKLGFPMAIKQASVLLSKLFVNSWINSYGVAVSAFAGIANKMSSSTNVLSNAFNTAGASMVGQNIGARRYERVKQVMLAVFRCTVSAAAVISVLIVLFPDQIYGFFTVDPQVLAIGRRYVPIAVLMFFGSAARSGMNALVNGSGNYKANFIMAVLDGIVMRIGLTLLFGLALGMRHYGFWLGDALAGYTPFVIGLIFYFSGAWRKR